MGFFWGVDQESIVDLLKKLFFDKVRTQKPGKSSLSVLAHDRNPSRLGRGRIGREGALDHRESRELRDKIFAPKTEYAKIFKKKLDQENSFQWEIFIFLAAGKLTFGRGYNFKTG